MTVAISIFNRNGVALAADSFNKVWAPNTNKYTLIDKIFSLSKKHSVGIMIYNLTFLIGTPWEIIIKVYSEHLGDKTFDTLKEYAEDFIKFLPSDKRLSDPFMEVFFIKQVLEACISEIIKSVGLATDYEKAVTNEIEKKLLFFSKETFIKGFDESFINVFIEKHSQELKEYIKMKPEVNFDIKTQENLIKLCAYVISKSNFLFNTVPKSGIVIVGYGSSEIFPSLYAYDVCTSIDGRLIYNLSQTAPIRADIRESINIFGETDVALAYINGIASELKNKILNEAQNYVNKLTKEILNKYIKSPQELSDKDKDELNYYSTFVMKDLEKKINSFQQKNYINPFLTTIDLLNKNELVNLVESLVNITLVKKRFLADEQNVGGPIDVAFINKCDGFIWIRKKMYYNEVTTK